MGSQFEVVSNDDLNEEENGVEGVSSLLESHTAPSSVLQGLLRKLGAGLDDLLSPSLPFNYVKRDVVRNGIKHNVTAPVSLANSSTIFSIRGNVYPDGLYFESMLVGNPPKLYRLDVDTGSDLT